MTARLSEGGFEFRKDITVYIFSDEAQRLKDWSPFDVLAPVSEMYIRGTFEVEVLIGVLISREPVEYLKYRALFHCERSLLADLEAGEFTTGHVGRLQNDDAQGDGNNASMKDAMFINVREFTQQPERVRCTTAPSRVRLQRIDLPEVGGIDLRTAGGIDLSKALSSAGLVTVSGGIRKDRKRTLDAVVSPRNLDELIDEVVQTRTQVMDEIPNDDAQFDRWVCNVRDHVDPLIHLRIELGLNGVSIEQIGGYCPFDLLEMSVRPVKFLLASDEGTAHGC